MLICESLAVEAIMIGASQPDTAGVIRRLSVPMAARLGLPALTIEQACLERERARSTALPNGVAIPHCRLANAERFAVSLAVLDQSIPWDQQEQPVEVVMMIAGPARSISDHLRILANSSRMLDSPAIRERLKLAPDAGSVHALLCAAEEAIEQRRAAQGILHELRGTPTQDGADFLAVVAGRFDW